MQKTSFCWGFRGQQCINILGLPFPLLATTKLGAVLFCIRQAAREASGLTKEAVCTNTDLRKGLSRL